MTSFSYQPDTPQPPHPFFPCTERQATRALLSAILEHRDVRNARVYYPVLLGANREPELVPIVAGSLVGGTEYIEEGLTLAVYPASSNTDAKKGQPDGRLIDKTITFKTQTLGAAQGPYYAEAASIRFVVQLYYRDATFRAPVRLVSTQMPESDQMFDPAKGIQFGRNHQFNDETQSIPFHPPEGLPSGIAVTKDSSVPIFTFPGEEVLRDWLPLLRKVVRDIPVLKPYGMRNPSILYVDYPTSNWLSKGQNLVFHSAYFLVQYDYCEAAREEDYTYPAPKFIGLDVQNN